MHHRALLPQQLLGLKPHDSDTIKKKKVDLGINPRRNISFPSQIFALLLPVFALDVDNKYDQIYPGPKVVPLCR